MKQVHGRPNVCNSCGETLNVNHVGPCPKCGAGNKLIKKNLQGSLSFTGSLSISYIKEFYKTHRKILIIQICIDILISIIGYILSGLIWTLVCLAISVLIIFLFPYIENEITKPRIGR